MNYFPPLNSGYVQETSLYRRIPSRPRMERRMALQLGYIVPQQNYSLPERSVARTPSPLRRAASNAYPSMSFSTPTKSEMYALSEEAKSLFSALGRPELITFSEVMNEVFGSDGWAFTGSVALTVYAQALNQKGSLAARIPDDVDILVDPKKALRISSVGEEAAKCISNLSLPSVWRNYSSFEFQALNEKKLSVDQLSHSEFGSLDEVETIAGIAVVTLEGLKKSKEAIESELEVENKEIIERSRYAAESSAIAHRLRQYFLLCSHS